MTSEILRARFYEQLSRAEVQLDPALSGSENMHRDVALAEQLIQSSSERLLIRFYWWQPWCISLGANQSEDDIDQDRARTDGIELVRRPTGGRAILHARELTYALAIRLQDGLTHTHVYHFWHEWLCQALSHILGTTELVYARSQPDFPLLLQQEPTRWLCFASSARYELLWRGRKVLGSAQRLYGDVLLQHGSLLVGQGHELLPYYLRRCTDPERLVQRLRAQSTTCSEIAGNSITTEFLAPKILHELRQLDGSTSDKSLLQR